MADDIKVIIGVDSAPVQRAVQLMNNLESEVRDVEKAEKKGLITRQRAAAETKRLTEQMVRLKQVSSGSAKDFYNFEKALVGSGKAARRNEIAIQQAGYQFQDFIVQVQGGTNPLIAFSQQGSQLAGFFAGPWGASIGLGIAVLGSFGMALMASIGTTKKFQDQLKDTTSTLDEYFNLMKSNSGVFSDAFEKNLEGLKLTSQASKDLLAIARIEAYKGVESLNASLTASVLSASYLKTEVQDVGNLINKGFIAKVSAGLGGKAGSEIRSLYTALVQLREAPTLEGQYEAALRVRDVFKQNVDVTGELTDSQRVFFKELSQTIQQMELLGAAADAELSKAVVNAQEEFDKLQKQKVMMSRAAGDERAAIEQEVTAQLIKAQDAYLKAIVEAHGAGKDLSKLDLKSPFDKALPAARQLAHEMKMSLIDALNLINAATADNGPVGRGRGKSRGVGGTASERFMLGLGGEFIPYPEKKSGGAKKAPKDPLVELNKRITLDEKLLGVSKERETVLRAIANSDKEYSDAAINGAISRLEAYNKEKELLEEAAAQQQNIADTLKNSMEDAFMSIVDGTKSAEDAFKDMARMIISELYKVLVVQQMVGSFEAGGGGILGSIFGAIGKRASGGTVMSNQPYLVGEKGPEVIVPQNRGHVMNADLTAKAMGGGGEGVVINQSFNFAANGDDSVKKLIAQAAPQIANMTQKQIMDSRRRGGALKSTFG
jgi:hypothetical protein